MTQPSESDTHVMSIDLISKLIVGLRYDSKSITPEFDLAKQLFHIVEGSLKVLNINDEVKLRGFNNSDLKVDWRLRLKEWTPHGINDQDLRLIYMIDCICIYTIFKLYEFNEKDLCLNPFLGYLLKLWKIFTNVVLLGLEIDRRVELIPDESTPNIVKQVIRGSSAVRYVLASILNDDVGNRYHDYHHVNILDFLSPYGRRNGSGGLYADVRWYVGAMLALGSELNEVVEVLVDLEPKDRYDEDVRYMFDYEYDDFHHELLYPEDYEDGVLMENIPKVYEDEDGNFHRIIPDRCDCIFFDEDREFLSVNGDEGSVDGDELQKENKFSVIPTAVRSNETIEFDEMGRDWRDVPREGNIFFNPNVKLDQSNCYDFDELVKKMKQMATEPVSDEISQKVLTTIARSVKLEFENEINKTVSDSTKRNTDEIPHDLVTPDKVYQLWSYDWIFEPLLALNPEAAYSMLDEMFMAVGYRRVLIWFITHLALSFSLINYIFELITGVRGESTERKMRFVFSRQGPLVLSEIEKSMLLHEFFNNCLIYLSKNFDRYSKVDESSAQNASEFEKCVKMVKLICLMVNKLLEKDLIDIEEYKVEVSSLLINWIGIVPEAKEIFFRINKKSNGEDIGAFEPLSDPEQQRQTTTTPSSPSSPSSPGPHLMPQFVQEQKHRKFNKELKVALGNVIKKLDSGSLLFRPFFGLIDHDNGSKQTGEVIEEGLDKLFQERKKPKLTFIPGSLTPLQNNTKREYVIDDDDFESS